ncbi:hypothetical protein LTR70_004747 [Exophiala xenobiotica]|uniref:Uncharacterized protein n=1 Tax=Lithohypha guttulata TaxID=1690604 RepID=A0ABR0KCA2_9EURO|nr:hypothetical protein LTR24_004363 [Lithohypha guttulata]KAK5319961.1 hypothetical protein LTR70_004747 [Exophiala xenobiotica]
MSAGNAELQRLLASLNGSSNGAPILQNVQTYVPATEMHTAHVPGLEALPHEAIGSKAAQLRGGSGTVTPTPPQRQMLQSSRVDADRPRSNIPAVPIPDASSITTWPAAIKHVTKYLSTNEKVMSRIKHLINEQHKHEEQWWTQRQAIVTKHAGRAGNQSKVADILKELGGLAAPVVEVDEAADRNELEAFDKKVYRSIMQMAADFDGQLRKMGVPFYAIKHELVVRETGKTEKEASMRTLDKTELAKLQKRILQHLEDLVSDD